MEWINIHTSTLDSEPMLDAEPQDRSTWLFLLRFCFGQENGGLIEGARKWSASKWQLLVRVSIADVKRRSPLWDWMGGDLSVKFYPMAKQLEVQAKRKGGSAGGKKRGAQLQAQAEASRSTHPQAQAEAELKTQPQGKGREGKGRKGNGRVREAESGDHSLDVLIPSEAEVRTWASMSAVDEAYAVLKWHETSERNGWVLNGHLLKWKERFKRFWETDKEIWLSKKKSGAASANGRPSGWSAGDQEWWWIEPVESVRHALVGACIANEEITAARLRTVIELRTKT